MIVFKTGDTFLLNSAIKTYNVLPWFIINENWVILFIDLITSLNLQKNEKKREIPREKIDMWTLQTLPDNVYGRHSKVQRYSSLNKTAWSCNHIILLEVVLCTIFQDSDCNYYLIQMIAIYNHYDKRQLNDNVCY